MGELDFFLGKAYLKAVSKAQEGGYRLGLTSQQQEWVQQALQTVMDFFGVEIAASDAGLCSVDAASESKAVGMGTARLDLVEKAFFALRNINDGSAPVITVERKSSQMAAVPFAENAGVAGDRSGSLSSEGGSDGTAGSAMSCD